MGGTMKTTPVSLEVRIAALFLLGILTFGGVCTNAQAISDTVTAPQAPAVPARITQAINEQQLVQLKGTVHPLARAEFDHGAVPAAQPMKRMLLLLQRSPEQQAALTQLMLEQQSKDSPNFHKWLTPQQFGVEFGPADADLQTVTDWLARQGFQGVKVANGRTVIEFTGNAAQVQNTFHTEIHNFVVNGQTYSANASEMQIPAALIPVVRGIVSLNNFSRKSYRRDAGIHKITTDQHGVPQFTSGHCGPNGTSPCFFVGPADFAKISNIPAGLDGTNVTIGIVGDSNINPQDAVDFRTLFGLTPTTGPTVIVDGPDPGIGGPNSDEGEADLDVQISGMVAPKAKIDFVVAEGTLTTQGTDLAAFRIIDYNLTDVISESFGSCEPSLGANGVTFFNAIWEQAAAQGITVMVSAGDNGSAACENFLTQNLAVRGLAVSGIASTPFNVAVGGTDFDDVGTQANFWNTTNSTDGKRESAKGYIPETTWNDSCAATATSANLNTVCAGTAATNVVGGSGGPSAFNAKPAFQNGLTPVDSFRDVPDVALFASDGAQTFSFYPNCEADAVPSGFPPSCAPNTQGQFTIGGAGGTSASSPAFAGIMALINQKMGGRQGNANFVLYKIAATTGQSCNSTGQGLSGSTCAFNDVTKGNNSVPCAGNSPNCSNATAANGVLVDPKNPTTPAWTTKTGYDFATGLGSVNVANLATAWQTAVGNFKGSTTSLTLNGGTTVNITHGANVTATATVAAKAPATGIPSGDVSLLGPQGTINSGINSGTLSSGTPDTASLNTKFLPGGSYSVTAHYAGDGTFAPSDSSAVAVVVGKENSRLQISDVMLDPNTGRITNPNTTAYPYGSFNFLRFEILNSSAGACLILTGGDTSGCAPDAQGAITVTDNGAPLDGGTFKINSAGAAEDQILQLTAGVHTLSATYTGDVSYNAVTVPVTDVITVSKATTASALSSSAPTVAANVPVTLTATISTNSVSNLGTTGTVTFFNGATQIGSPVAVVSVGAGSNTFAGGTAALSTSFATTGSKSITATYNGDTNYSLSNAAAIMVTVTPAATGTFTVTVPAAAQAITAGNTLMVPVTVTPAGGFTGGVTVNCTNLPPGVTCNGGAAFVITVPNGNGNTPVVGQLPIAVLGPSTGAGLTASAMPERNALPGAASQGLVMVGAGTGFAALFLLFMPGRKRLRAALGLGLVCLISLALGCGGGYGGGGGGTNQAPTISSIMPGSATAGGPAFTLTVNGTNFVSGSVVNFGGSAKTATYASTTQLMAAITAADIANAGNVAVTVTNPGGGTSNSVNFTVNGAAVATTTKITLTPPAKVPTGPNDVFVFNVAVTGGSTPAGNIQLLDGGANLGTPTALTANGTLMITENGLIPAGTHAISALYKGDAGHLTSSSGAINCTVTGQTTVTIAAQGATNGNQTLNVTIQ
jgi:hypothetical protein